MLDRGKIRTFVLGGIAGTLAGILLAPRSGKELRGSIASRVGEARELGRETYFDAQERARERLSEVRDRAPGTGEPEKPENPVTTGSAPQPPPNLGGPDETGFEIPAEERSPGPPPLRAVSREVPRDAPSGPRAGGGDPEELRRRIRETRSRLRERLEGPEGPSGKGGG